MRHDSSEMKANAIFLFAVLALGAFYGGVVAVVLWLLGYSGVWEIGGTVFRVAGGLGLLVALFFIAFFFSPRRELQAPMSWLERLFVRIACIALLILVAPLIIITGGLFWRWLSGKTDIRGSEGQEQV